MEEPSAGEREGSAPRMEEPSAGEREGHAPRREEYVLLNDQDHQDVRIITERSALYGDDVMMALTFPFEFRNVQAHYPILFQRDGQGTLYPVALFGFEERENLFLGETGWRAPYIPAMVRRAPFLIGFKKSSTSPDGGPTRMLSLDMAHPRVNREIGEPLFQPFGGRTPFLENAADLLETIYAGTEHSAAFVAALQEHDLVESVTFEIVLNDGSRNELIGFSTIAEEKVQALRGNVLEEFNNKGYLMPLFMAMASLANVQGLVELKNEKLAPGIRE